MKKFSRFLTILSVLLFLGCTIGLGESIDLEAPSVKITSHENMQYVARSFTLSGTCYDNVEVTGVVVTNTKTGAFIANGVVNGTTWYANLTFEADAEVPLTVTASDAIGNQSENSVAAISLICDAANPYLKKFYIKRNDTYLVNLKEKSELEELDASQSVNKDYFQNEKIEFFGEVYDNYRAKTVSLNLLDEDGNIIIEGIENHGDSAYSPKFTLTQDMLAAYTSGRTYFRLSMTLLDEAGNSGDQLLKFFCWYPESDIAKISSSLESGGEINVGANAAIPVNVFDDDGLAAVHYRLFSRAAWEAAEADFAANYSGSYDYSGFSSIDELNGVRDAQITFGDTSDAGPYVFVVAVQDYKPGGSSGVWTYRAIPTYITNADSPIIYIDSPAENTSPTLTGTKFTLTGYVYDNSEISTENIGLAWIPANGGAVSDAAIAAAKSLLSGASTANSYGIRKFDDLTIGDSQSTTIGGKSYFTRKFSREFDITTDFKGSNGTAENATKVFVVYVMDADGNKVYNTYRLGAYYNVPDVTLSYSTGGSSYSVLTDMASFNIGTKLYLKATATGANNLPLKRFSGTIKGDTQAAATTISSLDGFELSLDTEDWYIITLTATDIFGNTAVFLRTVVSTTIPTLERFSSGMQEGIRLIKGEKLTMQAEFSQSVTVTGSPRVQLTNISGASGTQYATYTGGSGSDTLIFTYTVPTGVYSETNIGCQNYIDLNGGAINFASSDGEKIYIGGSSSATVTGKLLEDNSKIYVDSVAPALVPASCVPANGSYSLSASATGITLAFSEDVYKESGNITIKRTDGWAIPIVLTESEFNTVYAQMSDTYKTAMIGTSTGEAKCSDTTGQPVGPYVKTTHGLKESGGNYVPDTATKYVLQFDLDPHATTGTVATLRKAFESISYHQKVIDVTSSSVTVSGKDVTIALTDFFADGREWEVLIDEGTFRDAAGNTCGATTSGAYAFWTNTVATPVIRADKYTHGWGAQEPDSGGSLTTITKNNSYTRPSGYVCVRIDSETPGTTIKYGISSSEYDATSGIIFSTTANPGTSYAPAAITTLALSALTAGTSYSTTFILGNEKLYVSGRYYLKAVATHPQLSISEAGTEGVYKTIIFYKNVRDSSSNPLELQGRDSKGGVSLIAGFPVRDADPDERYSKYFYKIRSSDVDGTHLPNGYDFTDGHDWVSISYDFVSTWYIQTHQSNWQNNSEWMPGDCSYGDFYFTYDRTNWSWK